MYLTDRTLKSKLLSNCEQLREGRLTLKTPEGDTFRFGNGGDEAELVIRDWSAISAISAHGQVGLGEAYVQGLWDTPSIEALLSLAMRNRDQLGAYDRAGTLTRLRHRITDTILRANSRRGSRRNIRAHYDVGNEFYNLWLDEGMSYSSALFEDGCDDLYRGQSRKNERVLSRLADGESVLEIGCGWGGFAEQAAEGGRCVSGVTISRNQHAYAEARLDGRADIQFRDYREVNGKYDSIVSIEMIEAVGARFWPGYFDILRNCLADRGKVVLQAITVPDACFDSYQTSSDYIRQHVFPGGMLLSDKVIADEAKAAGLSVVDNFAFGQDYARTCRIWAARLASKKRQILEMGYGEEFFRNWLYYLEICAASFAVGNTNVVQVELAHA